MTRIWKLKSVVADGERLEIEGHNVWSHRWISMDEADFKVPHPSYSNQRHKLSPFYIEVEGNRVIFAAGELSNSVWCFYVPS